MADLLTPQIDHASNYVHQLRTTLNAYLPSYVYVGEALQNALDASREKGSGTHRITVLLDLPSHRVLVRDQGPGFPNEPRLLFLGGGNKQGRKYGGLVGVGLKVVLFSSSSFCLRARTDQGSLRFELNGANKFDQSPRPTLVGPDTTFSPDPDPLPAEGTELSYSFSPDAEGAQAQFFRVLEDEVSDRSFAAYKATLQNAVDSSIYPNRLAALLGLYLQRFSYLGLTNVPQELEDAHIDFAVNIGQGILNARLEELSDQQTEFSFSLKPTYVDVQTTVGWIPIGKIRPALTDKPLLNGGRGLSRTDFGFNTTTYTTPDEYETLLLNSAGKVALTNQTQLDAYRRRLFPRINSIRLTIGRIQELEKHLPGGARHVLSANGVVTNHAVEFNRGQNQQYVRCFDIAVDVDAELNYGKTQLNDMHLVGLFRRFLNDAYAYTIQHAAKDFVGKLQDINADTNDEFFGRPELEVPPLTQVRVPRSENDVIALIFELAGQGHLPEYRWFGLSSKDTYDSRAAIQRPCDPGNYLENLTEGKVRVVEFKLRAGSIAVDFMQESKDPRRVNLLIAYELGSVTVAASELFQILELQESRAYASAPDKVYPGVTHVMYDAKSGAEVQILLVQNLLNTHYPEPPEAAPLPVDVIDE